ncbi:MAG: HyaD/HybD family hydrogenase maturation endopeptidase [Candidatus Methylomirabilia bacterium]
MKTLVLGIGNVLLQDEGVGIHAIGELQRRFTFDDDVEFLDGGTAGVELLRYLDGKDRILIVDAVAAGHPPGTVFRVESADVPRMFHRRISPHQIGLSDVLATALISDSLPAEMVLFGMEPQTMTTGLALTATAEASLAKLVDSVADELRRLGHRVEERTNPPPRQLEWNPHP